MDLSIKNAPDRIVERLRDRARRRKIGLTTHDANDLHLTQLLEAELVTLDKQLGRTAGH